MELTIDTKNTFSSPLSNVNYTQYTPKKLKSDNINY